MNLTAILILYICGPRIPVIGLARNILVQATLKICYELNCEIPKDTQSAKTYQLTLSFIGHYIKSIILIP